MKNAITATRKLRMKFGTAAGDELNVTLNYAKDGLTDGDGAQLVKTAMQTLYQKQPFKWTLSEIRGAEVIETTVTDVEM